MKSLCCRSRVGRVFLVVACSFIAAGCFAADLKYLEEKGEGDYDVVGSLTVKAPASLEATLVFAVQDKTADRYALKIRAGKASLSKFVGSKTAPLGLTVPLALKAGQTVPFTLQRRQWRLALVWDNVVVLRAFDRSLGNGKVGSKAAGGTWDDLRIQPVGDLNAADDFVREEGAQSIWEPSVGTWEAKTLRDDEQAAREEADKSANAFSYFGTGLPHGITLAGNWFWEGYSLEAACRPMGRGAFGVVFYYQDENNYLVLRDTCVADPAPNGDRLQLIAVRGGKQTILGEKSGGYEPGQWYKLRVRVCDDVIQCFVDDDLRLQATSRLFGQGQIGLYVEGKTGCFFDDVVCAPWDAFRDDFAAAIPGKWALGPGFTQANGALSHTGGKSLCVGGQLWQRYVCSVNVGTAGPGSAGLAYCFKADNDYCLLSLTAGKAQLVQVTPQGHSVLAEKPLTSPAGKHRLRVSVENGLLTGTVDDALRLQATVPGATGGAIAFVAEGKAVFDDFTLSLLTPRRGSHVTKEFAIIDKHPEMEKWASTRGAWVPPAEGKDDWWSKGDYFGDASVTFVIPAIGSKTGTARAIIGSEPGGQNGLTLLIAATEKSKKLTFTLSAADQPLKTAETEVEGGAHIAFSRESGVILVTVNDKVILTVSR